MTEHPPDLPAGTESADAVSSVYVTEDEVDEADLDPAGDWVVADELDVDPPNPYADLTDDDKDQDDLTDMGAAGDAPRTSPQAIDSFREWHAAGRPVEPYYCLRYTRGWWQVAPLYASALESLLGAPEKRRIGDWRDVPRGRAFYMRGGGSIYGHVGITLGGGMVGTTDWPRGRLGIVNGGVLAQSWGYAESWLSPFVNNVRVWRAPGEGAGGAGRRGDREQPQRKADPSRGPRIDHAVHDLALARRDAKGDRAAAITRALKALRTIDPS